MSGSTIGGVVGGAIGFWIGGPTGAQIGFMAGSALGSSFDTQHIQGPRLGDLPVQTSQEGAPRPIIYGTPQPFFCNLMQCGPHVRVVREVEQEGGKGGPKVVSDTEEVFISFALRISEGDEDLKLLRLWADGKLFYSAFGEGLEADSVTAASKFTFYAGGEDQNPDPTLESLPPENGGGIDNVPAYRGTSYIVFDNFNVTAYGGRIPQIQVQVSNAATVTTSCVEGLLAWWPLDDASPGGTAREIIGGQDGLYTDWSGATSGTVESRASLNATGAASTWFADTDRMRATVEGLNVDLLDGWSASVWYRIDSDAPHEIKALGVGYGGDLTGDHGWGNFLGNDSGTGDWMTPMGGFDPGTAVTVSADADIGSTVVFQVTVYDSGTLYLYVNGVLVDTRTGVDGTLSPGVGLVQVGGGLGGGGLRGQVQDLQLWGRALSQTEIQNMLTFGPGVFENPDAPGTYMRYDGTTISPCSSSAELSTVTLASIVTDIARRAGIDASQLDITADESVEVDGYLIGRQMTAQSALSPLALAYFRDYPEYDLQIHSVPRGGSVVATLTDDDFLEGDDDELSLSQKIELPRKINVAYSDKDSNYARRIQMAERESINIPSTGEMEVELALVLNANAAAQKAEIMLKTATEESLGLLKRRLPAYKHADLVVTDRLGYDSKEWRIDRLEWMDGEIAIEAKRDRISNYTSAAVGGVALDPTAPVSSVKGPSVLQALNLPRLVTAWDTPGMVIAVTGLTNAWPGSQVYISLDQGATWPIIQPVSKRATMGYLNAAIDTNDEPINVTVFNERALASITVDQLSSNLNGIAITTDGESEVAQFQAAAETDDDIWDLTSVTRGMRGTTAASHSAEDKWLLLDEALVFVPIPIEHAGTEIWFRAVTRGTPVENNEIVTAIYMPLFTGPESIDYLLDETGAQLLDEADAAFLLEE